ncbi:MAG TPA: pyridoxamine 5'-phosphate oxidase family protein [bacterium]|nr:pyridoxamine 5'-phosphate oxidase family protein [bacterium]
MGVELSSAEIDAFLLSAPRLILCISRPGRAPLPLPMWFGWLDGKIYMHTLQASKKMAPLRSNPEVACLVESGEHYYTLKAVLIIGTCEISDDQEQVRRIQARINETKPIYSTYRPSEWPPHLARHYAKPRSLLTVTPKSITSWDFQKIRH